MLHMLGSPPSKERLKPADSPVPGKGRRNTSLTAHHELLGEHRPGRRGGGSADDLAHPESKPHNGERENLTREPKPVLSDL